MIHIMHEGPKQQGTDTGGGEVVLHLASQQKSVAGVHNSDSMPEVMEGIVSVVVQMFSFLDKVEEDTHIHCEGLYHSTVEEDYPRILVKVFGVFELEEVYTTRRKKIFVNNLWWLMDDITLVSRTIDSSFLGPLLILFLGFFLIDMNALIGEAILSLFFLVL